MDKRELNEKLIQAANGGDKEKVENLLSEGAESGYKNAKGETAFTQAANGGHIDIVAKFLDQDHDINETGRNELTAISFAASRGHLDIALWANHLKGWWFFWNWPLSGLQGVLRTQFR